MRRMLSALRERAWGFPMYILSHPFKGFEEMKDGKKGSIAFAVWVLLLSCALNVLEYVYTGFLVNENNPYRISTLYLMMVTAFPVVLFVVGNWSVTTLLNGKGKMREIFMAMMYALYPYCLLRVVSLILSNVLLLDEMTISYAISAIGAAVFALYLFVGLVVVHDYSFSQGVGMILLTLFAILVIVFIIMLGLSLAADVLDFFVVFIRELRLKL